MLGNLTIRARMALLIVFMSLLTAVLGVGGLYGIYAVNRGMETVYADRTVPMAQLSEIERLMLGQRIALTAATFDTKAEEERAAVARIESAQKRIAKVWDEYMATYLTPEEKKLAEKFAADQKRLLDEGIRPALEHMNAVRIKELEDHIRAKVRPLFVAVSDGMEALMKLQIDVAGEEYKKAEGLYATLRAWAIAGIILGIALAIAIGTMISRAIVGGINQSVRIAERIADGKLDNRIDAERSDEVGALLKALKNMNDSLRGIVREVREGAGTVANGSAEIARGNADLSSRTEEQASSLEETASSMEELTSTVKQNTENARQANQLAAGASVTAGKGGTVMGEVVATMSGISEASRKIADIIAVIDGIAFQTNILALNAAVEAARAGEQGRGFAVVASEVRALAQRSAAAAKEIKGLIENSVERVGNGTKLVESAGQTMEEIVVAVKRVTDVISEIAAASQEQLNGIEQVSRAVMQMDQVVQQNAALVEESAAAAENMAAQSDTLVQTVGRFRLGDGEDQAVTRAALPSAAQAQVQAQAAPLAQLGGRALQRRRAKAEQVDLPKLRAVRQSRQANADNSAAAKGSEEDWKEF